VMFVLSFLGLETYHNIALMQRGYLLQKLELKKRKLEKENGYLQEKLSPYFSLNRVETYAREKLGLIEPVEVRFLKENFSPPEESSSPPQSESEKGIKNHILQIVNRIRKIWSSFYEEK